ncbi:MAG: LacI family DNA-binding transcriptional regulator [Thermotogaceae bacterium]|nr:LacI family DNA-binding transcriptional regulator [Thermotogaceae bacterium]
MKKVTLKDIAKMVGVSPSTVSRALANLPGVSEDLRLKIKEIAKEMGYIPDMAAKSLKTRQMKTVGIIVPDITNPFFTAFLKGIDSVFFSRGYKFIIGNTDETPEREKVYIEWFLSHGVDGIIAAPSEYKNKELKKTYKNVVKLDIPLIFFDRVIASMENNIDIVKIDNESAVKESLEYLKDMGHKEVGILLGKKGMFTMDKREAAFIENVEKLGLKTKDEWILKDLFPEWESYENIKNFLRKRKKPTAIILANQSLTITFLKVVNDLKIKIPDDVSIITFDDSIENEFYCPPITAIRQPAEDMGKISATVLLGRIEGDVSKPSKILLKTELKIRKSVKRLEVRR